MSISLQPMYYSPLAFCPWNSPSKNTGVGSSSILRDGTGEGTGTPLQYSCLENPWMEEPGRPRSMASLKSRTRLSNFTFLFPFHALEKEMATHSSVLAWRIPGTGEPGGLPSMGSHRVGHDWSDLAAGGSMLKDPSANVGDSGSNPG